MPEQDPQGVLRAAEPAEADIVEWEVGVEEAPSPRLGEADRLDQGGADRRRAVGQVAEQLHRDLLGVEERKARSAVSVAVR